MPPAEMYVATKTFCAVIDGKQTMVHKGRDLVRAGHPVLEQYPDMFKPAHVRFDVEQATAAPGEKRGFVAGGIFPPPQSLPDDVHHAGGGWYVTSDGERHRGRDAALEHLHAKGRDAAA